MSEKIEYSEGFLCRLRRSKKIFKDPIIKLGGSPVFYEHTEWPICQTCGQELDFLAQIPLDAPIHFSHRYSLAYVFMCPGKFDEKGWLVCPTWRPNSGANKVILQEKSNHPLLYPHDSEYPDYEVSLERVSEAIIDTSKDLDLPEDILLSVHQTTKLGGVPTWLQNNETPSCPICGGVMKFVAQLDAILDGPYPAGEWDSDKYKFFHFGGDDGIGYLFICENECSSDYASFLWQCT